MGYKIKLNSVDRQRLANIFKLAEHVLANQGMNPQFTGEDVALVQKLRKVMEDKYEYFIIVDEEN